MTDFSALLASLNGLTAGLFLLSSIALAATRQVQGCLRFYLAQSLFLVCSGLILAFGLRAPELLAVAALDLLIKLVVIPWLLWRMVPEEIFHRREIDQVLNIPSSLLIALGLTLMAYLLSARLPAPAAALAAINSPVGLASLLIGTYTLAVRREAVPQLIGIFSIENGALFVGIAVAPTLPLVAEMAFPFDMLVIAIVIGILTRMTQERIGTTEVGGLASLKEGASL